MDRAVDYDACYTTLELPIGSPMPAIRKSRNRLAKLLHTDLNRGVSDEPMKAVLAAYDALERWWKANRRPPPSGPMAGASFEDRKPWPGPKPHTDRPPSSPHHPPEPKLTVPPVQKGLPHDLIDWIETVSDFWPGIYAAVWFVVFVTSILVFNMLPLALPDDIEDYAILIWMAVSTVPAFGLHAYRNLYAIDLDRSERSTSIPASKVRGLLSQVLSRHPVATNLWIEEPSVYDPGDRSHTIVAHLWFEHAVLGLLKSRYQVDFYFKYRGGGESTSYACWFVRRSTGLWWPPVERLTRAINDDLRRTLA